MSKIQITNIANIRTLSWLWIIIGYLCIMGIIFSIPPFIESFNEPATDQTILQIIAERCPPPIRTNETTGEQCSLPTIKLTDIYADITGHLMDFKVICIYDDAHIGILTTDIIHGDWFTIDELRNISNLHWVMMEDL